jgi:hypothetical protein
MRETRKNTGSDEYCSCHNRNWHSGCLKLVEPEDEEQLMGIFDVANIAYPILARTLTARRDNLLATIGLLEARTAESDMAV